MIFVILIGVVFWLSACSHSDLPMELARSSATIQPASASPVPFDSAAAANSSMLPTLWQPVTPGVEVRTVIPPNATLAQMVAVRLDPAQVQFRVHYQPREPRFISQWQAALPDAVVIVNANFFTPEHVITGMLVSDGQAFGRSFTDRGGMFSVQNGQPVIQSLIAQPYDGRPLEQAVQAFPMLVDNRAPAYHRATDTRASRRTVVGMDDQGRVLLLATPGIGLGLYDLSQWLASSDLNLVRAFNLDGGRSTMMAIRPSGYVIHSIDAVPAVLAVYPR